MSTETTPHFINYEQWLQSRKELLQREKAFTRQRDKLSRLRRELPMVRIEEDYTFETERGEESLVELFKGHGQLIVYHFMFATDWSEGCKSCSFWMDNFSGIAGHLAARDTSFVVSSTALLDSLLKYKHRMGWNFDWVSSGGGSFNRDFGVTFTDSDKESPSGSGYNYTGRVFGNEMPGLSVFRHFTGNCVAHTYSTYGRGLDILNGAYNLLDLTQKGRDEDDLDFTMAWVKRRDSYV